MELTITKKSSTGKKSKKDRQHSHNAMTGKYKSQEARTLRNQIRKSKRLLVWFKKRETGMKNQVELAAKVKRLEAI